MIIDLNNLKNDRPTAYLKIVFSRCIFFFNEKIFLFSEMYLLVVFIIYDIYCYSIIKIIIKRQYFKIFLFNLVKI